jgi:predicted hotdog family 3-hydroxylacyl-ACP dehydratase
MALLSRVLAHDAEETICSVDVQPGTLFSAADGSVPVWVGIEYMAQCVAAHAGLEGHARGIPPRMGFLIGSRRIETRTPRFEPAQVLVVRARRTWGKSEGMVSFDCDISDAETRAVLVEGRLNCFLPAEGSALGSEI